MLKKLLTLTVAGLFAVTPVLATAQGAPQQPQHQQAQAAQGQQKPKLKHPQEIRDRSQYNLPQPPQGQKYVVEDNQVYRVDSSTLAVVATVGLVSALMAK